MAIGVAQNMEKLFKNLIKLSIYTNESKEAENYIIKGHTSVFLNGKMVPLKVAISDERMTEYLRQRV